MEHEGNRVVPYYLYIRKGKQRVRVYVSTLYCTVTHFHYTLTYTHMCVMYI
jgi:hypothetical protein